MLEEKIAEMGLTVEAMAEKIGMAPAQARQLIEGNQSPKKGTLISTDCIFAS